MAKTRKTRMNETIREAAGRFLRQWASTHPDIVRTQAEVLRTGSALVRVVRSHMDTTFPPEDMEVLARYDMIDRTSRLYVYDDRGRAWEVFLPESTAIPKSGVSVRLRERPGVTEAVLACAAARKEADDAHEKVHAPLYFEIRGTRYLEDLLEVWPEATEALSRYQNKPPEPQRGDPERVREIRAEMAQAVSEGPGAPVPE